MNDKHRPSSATTFLLVTGSRMALLVGWFLATALLMRKLGPAGFGIYFLAQSAIRVLTGSVGDPIDMAVMREAPLLLGNDRPGALAVIRSAFWLRTIIALLLLVPAILLPSVFARIVFASPLLRGLAVLTVAGVLGDFLLRSCLGYFQVSEQFGRFLAVDAVWQFSRVVAVLFLIATNRLTAASGVALYVIAPYLAFLVALPLLPGDVRRSIPPDLGPLTRMLKFSVWIATALAMGSLYERLDVFILTRFTDDTQVGIYGGAVFLATIPDFLDGIIQTVIAPKIAPAYAAGRFNRLFISYLTYALPLGTLAGLFAILLGNWGIHRWFPPTYGPCVPAFRVLVVSTLFNLVFTTLPNSLVNFIAPKRQAIFTGVGLLLVSGGCMLLIPSYGAVGAAFAMLGARAVVGLLAIAQALQLSTKPIAEGAKQTWPAPERSPEERL
jgi:O-antigen/teichoic acid export membrane protein